MRGLQVIALTLLAAIVGFATGNRILVLISLGLVVVLAVGLAYRFFAINGVRGDRVLIEKVVTWGQPLRQKISIVNHSSLTIPTIQVIDQSTLPELVGGFVTRLQANKTINWNMAIPCRNRGRYRIGPITVSMNDPLGLFPKQQKLGEILSFLVLPRWVQLNRCALKLDGFTKGEVRSRRRGESPPNVSSVRSYQNGDTLSMIHWPLVARTGELMTKTFAPEVLTRVWLAVDLDRALPTEQEEALVTAATSVGLFALRKANLNVGLVTSGKYPAVLVAGRGRNYQYRLQEMLAEAKSGGEANLEQQFVGIERRIASGNVIVLFTAQSPEHWIDWIGRFVAKGIAVRVIQVGKSDATLEAWPVPMIFLPDTVADPAHDAELVAALEIAR